MSQGVKVFVGSLPPGISEATVKDYFAQYGTLLNAIVKPDQRYGFVFYASMEEAQVAINNLNGFALEGATIVVKLADKQGPGISLAGGMGGDMAAAGAAGSPAGGVGERIYVKGLPAGMTDLTVREVFSAYGTVSDTKVLVSDGKSVDGTGQSVAIIKMGDPGEAQWLVENLNGNIPQGLTRPVEVSHAGSRGPAERISPYGGGKGAGPGAQMQQHQAQQQHHHQALMGGVVVPPGMGAAVPTVSRGGAVSAVVPTVGLLKSQVGPGCKLYVKGLPAGADDTYLYKVFAPWGRILEAVAIAKESYCIGFVQFLTEPEAQEAIANVNGVTLTDGTTLSVSVKVQK